MQKVNLLAPAAVDYKPAGPAHSDARRGPRKRVLETEWGARGNYSYDAEVELETFRLRFGGEGTLRNCRETINIASLLSYTLPEL